MKNKKNASQQQLKQLLSHAEPNPEAFWEYLQTCNSRCRRDALRAWCAHWDPAAIDFQHPCNERIRLLLELERLTGQYQLAFSKSSEKAKSLHPPKNTWIKAVFLPLEFHFKKISKEQLQADPDMGILREFPGSNKSSLIAARTLVAHYDKMECNTSQWKTENWAQLQAEAMHMLNLGCDYQLLEEMIDCLLQTNAHIKTDTKGEHITIVLSEEDQKINSIIAHKELLKAIYNKRAAQISVSDTDYFKRIDGTYKTNEGIVSWFSSPGTILTPGNPGHVAMELPEDCWYKGDDRNSPEAKKAEENSRIATFWAHQSYFFRQHLSSNLFVREKENFKGAVLFEAEEQRLTFFDFFMCMANIVAIFTAERKYRPWKSWRGLAMRIQDNIEKGVAEGEIASPPSWLDIIRFAAAYGPENKVEGLHLGCFYKLSAQTLINLTNGVDDLAHLCPKQILQCFDLLADPKASFPIPLVIKAGNDYQLPVDAWSHPAVMQWLFEDFYTGYIYDTDNRKTPEEKKRGTTLAQLRESGINEDVASLLRSLTPHASASAGYRLHESSGSLIEGECDAIAWFPQESTLLVIQMKLSNTTKATRQKRKQWVSNKLQKDAAAQVAKDLRWFQRPESRLWLQNLFPSQSEEFTMIKPGRLNVRHLILTDNFYFDHQCVTPQVGQPVTVISLFEFAMLIRNEDVFEPLSQDWFRERLIRINQCFPEISLPYDYNNQNAMSMAANQPSSEEHATLRAFIESNPTQDASQISTLDGLMSAIAENRFWSLLDSFFWESTPQVRELVCLQSPNWIELVG
jgi:hypothetical protein